jgi:hypothetical protein
MYPNSELSAWQLTLMAVVAVVLLAAWLIAVFLAAREPSRHEQAAAGSPAGTAATDSGSLSPTADGEKVTGRPPADQVAA